MAGVFTACWRWILVNWSANYTIAAAGCVYTFFAILQWRALRKSVDETQDLVRTANRQAKAAEEQVANLEKTLAATEIAAGAAKFSAETANRMASSARSIDRAWMLLDRLDPPPLEPIPVAGTPPPAVAATYSYKNYGKTPAFILSIKAKLIQIGKLDDLPQEPDYGANLSGVPKGIEVVVVPERSSAPLLAVLALNPLLRQDEIDKIVRSETILYAFGCVAYRDVFDETHETRWGFAFKVPAGVSTFRGWLMGGPPAYNRHE